MPNIFRATLVQRMYGQECQNVLHFTGPSSDPNELSALADHLAANWVAKVKVFQTSAITYTGIKTRLLESQFPTFIKTTNIAGNFGFDDEVHTMVTWLLRLRSSEIGKRGRGRQYISGVLKGWTKNGLVTDAQITLWNAKIAELLAIYGPSGSSTYRLVLCPSKAPFSTRAVTSMQIAPMLGVQRRRNIGVGV